MNARVAAYRDREHHHARLEKGTPGITQVATYRDHEYQQHCRSATAKKAEKNVEQQTPRVADNSLTNKEKRILSRATSAPQSKEDEALYPSGYKVKGGELTKEIAASELDACLQPLLNVHYVSALRYYTASTSRDPLQAATFLRDMDTTALKHGWVLFPMIERRHWVTAVVSRVDRNKTHTIVYDSCPHPAVHDDIRAFYKRAGGAFKDACPPHVCHARQPRDSYDCGLHVILIALWRHLNLRPLLQPDEQEYPQPMVSLSEWRVVLKRTQCRLTPDAISHMINCIPGRFFSDYIKGGAQPENRWGSHITSFEATPKAEPIRPIPPRPQLQANEREYVVIDDEEHEQLLEPEDILEVDIRNVPLEWDDLLRLERLTDSAKADIEAWKAQEEQLLADTGIRVTAQLRRVPEVLRRNPLFMTKARNLAKSLIGKENVASNAAKFNFWRSGEQLTDTLVDHVTAQLKQAALDKKLPFDWTIIPCNVFALFARFGIRRHLPALGSKVACVVHQPEREHFVTFVFDGSRDPGDRLCVYDSIFRPTHSTVQRATIECMGRFVALLQSAGLQNIPTEASMRTCPPQKVNDCGLEAVNNLVRATTGHVGTFTREQIRQAWVHYSKRSAGDFSFKLFSIAEASDGRAHTLELGT